MKTKKVFGVCVVCGGNIVENFEMKYDPKSGPIVFGQVSREQFCEVSLGYCCEDCGIHYDNLPNKQAKKRLKKRDENILWITPKAKKRFNQKLKELEKSLNPKPRDLKV